MTKEILRKIIFLHFLGNNHKIRKISSSKKIKKGRVFKFEGTPKFLYFFSKE